MKFRVDQLQSHEEGLPIIYEELRKYFPIYEEAASYMTLQLLHYEFPYVWGKLDFFLSVW